MASDKNEEIKRMMNAESTAIKRQRIDYGCQPTADDSCTFPGNPEKKKRKHTKYFCPHQSNCELCNPTDYYSSVPESNFITRERHYLEKHPYKTEEYVEIEPAQHIDKWFTLEQDFGRVLCKYRFNNGKFQFFVYTPFDREQLSQYDCKVNLSSFNWTPRYQATDKMADWKLQMPELTFSGYVKDGKARIKVTITRKQQ